MKRLMIALSAAALAFGLQAADVAKEGFTSTTAYSPAFTTITGLENCTTNSVTYSYTKSTTIGGPTAFGNGKGDDHLVLKTPFNTPATFGFTSTTMEGLYFDSMVKFTACDEAPAASDYTGAKIIVWVKETENSDSSVTKTVMVTAGYLNDTLNSLIAKDYSCGDPSTYGIESDTDWCRLTIKAIPDISAGYKVPGFIIYINGTVVKHNGDATSIGVDGSAREYLAMSMIIPNKNKTLFPSMVGQDSTLSSVAFAGQGEIDDLIVSTTEPTDVDGEVAFYTPVNADLVEIAGVNADEGNLDSVEKINAQLAKKAGQTVKLMYDFAGDLVFPVAGSYVLDLNGKTLSKGTGDINILAGSTDISDMSVKATVTIKDSSTTNVGEYGKIEGIVYSNYSEPTFTLVAGKINVNQIYYSNDVFTYSVTVSDPLNYDFVKVDNDTYWTVAEVTENGTQAKPWKIASAADLVGENSKIVVGEAGAGKYYKMTGDIALEGTYTPISGFCGIFDGDNHKISNLVFDRANGNYQGLFGSVTNATVSNLKLELAGWTGEATAKDGEYGGAALVGAAYGSATFNNITVYGSTTGATHNVAGIVCRTYGGDFTFNNCTNKAEVSGSYTKVGGLVNMVGVSGTTTFNDCSNEGHLYIAPTNGVYGGGYNAGVGAFVAYTADKAKVVLSGCSSTGKLENQNTTNGQGFGAFVNAPNADAGSVAAGAKPNVAKAEYLPGTIRTSYYTGFGAAVVADGLATWYDDYATAMAALGDATAVKVFVKNSGTATAIDFTEIANVADGKVGVGTKVNKELAAADLATYVVADNYIAKTGDAEPYTYTVTAKTDLSTAVATITATYGDEAPAVVVTDVAAADYQVVYDPAFTATTDAGTVITAVVTAVGNAYKGALTNTFTVAKKTVVPTITFTKDSVAWDIDPVDPVVKVGEELLVKGEGYSVSNNWPTANVAEDTVVTYYVDLTTKNYQASSQATLTVTKKNGEDGTIDAPWQIASAGDFANKLAKCAGRGMYFELTADVDLGTAVPLCPQWESVEFTGVFDGKNHTVTYRLSDKDHGRLALIGKARNATFKNLVVNGTFESNTINSGAIVLGQGYENITFENVTAKGSYTSCMSNAGGFICNWKGENGAKTLTFTSCTNEATLTTGYTKAGGFVAYDDGANNDDAIVMTDCLNKGNITCSALYTVDKETAPGVTNAVHTATGAWVGGMIGWAGYYKSITLTNCRNEGNLSAKQWTCGSGNSTIRIGGMIGNCFNALTMTGCSNEGSITGLAEEVGTSQNGGGIGGLLGWAGAFTISGCSNMGVVKYGNDVDIKAFTKLGSIVGNATGTITVSGKNEALGDIVAVGNKLVDGLNYATIADSVATFVANSDLVKDGKACYRIMTGTASATNEITLAAGQSIRVVQTLAGVIVKTDDTEANEITSFENEGVYTYTCNAKTVPVDGVELDITSTNLTVNDVFTLTATVSPDNATDQTVTWTSDNEDVATVDENGMVTAVGAGEATITATAGEQSVVCYVTVVAAAGPVIPVEQGTIEVDKEDPGHATVKPEADQTEIEITGGENLTQVDIPTTVEKIKGVDSEQVHITYNSGLEGAKTIDITSAFTLRGDATQGVTRELNPEGSVEISGETIPVTPTITEQTGEDAPAITDGSLETKSIPGLTYELKCFTSLEDYKNGADPAATSGKKTATGTTLDLTAMPATKPTSAFWVIYVTK